MTAQRRGPRARTRGRPRPESRGDGEGVRREVVLRVCDARWVRVKRVCFAREGGGPHPLARLARRGRAARGARAVARRSPDRSSSSGGGGGAPARRATRAGVWREWRADGRLRGREQCTLDDLRLNSAPNATCESSVCGGEGQRRARGGDARATAMNLLSGRRTGGGGRHPKRRAAPPLCDALRERAAVATFCHLRVRPSFRFVAVTDVCFIYLGEDGELGAEVDAAGRDLAMVVADHRIRGAGRKRQAAREHRDRGVLGRRVLAGERELRRRLAEAAHALRRAAERRRRARPEGRRG